MKKSRIDTVKENLEDFLAGKSEEYKNKFNSKTLDQQYAAIANWKRNAKNLGSATKDLAKVTANTVIGYLKEAHKNLLKVDSLTPKETQKLHSMLESVKESIDNFTRIKDQQMLEALKNAKVALAKQNEALDKQIQELENKLN